MTRSKRKSIASQNNSIAEEPNDQGNITMTQEAFTTLLTTIQQSQAEFQQQLIREFRSSTPQVEAAATSSADATMAVLKSTANFAKCTSKFSGNPEESVDNFIEAIEVYKSCLNISDESALMGMSMLLTSNAGIWWQGVRRTTKTWEEAITKLRSAYGEHRLPYRIYVELFSLVQGNEKTDLFVAKVRALLSKLPHGDLSERVELDMTFGLLDRRIRKRVDRTGISSFDDLLTKARAVEDALNEPRDRPTLKSSSNSSRAEDTRAANSEPARVKASAAAESSSASRSSTAAGAAAAAAGSTSDTASKSSKNKTYCVYCKRAGHTKDTCDKLKNVDKKENSSIKCYGCGTPNVIRSKCTKCNNKSENSAFYSFNNKSSVKSKVQVSQRKPGKDFNTNLSSQQLSFSSNNNVDSNFCRNSSNAVFDENNVCFCTKTMCACTKTNLCTCCVSKMCMCTVSDQGEFASHDTYTLRSVEFRGSQPFFEEPSGSQLFSGNIPRNNFFSEISSGGQHLCGITSGSQPFSDKRSNVKSFLRPVLKISILGENGIAMVDSAAKSCVAGHTLYTLLKAKGHPMSSRMENIKLADGVSRLMNVLTTKVDVTLQGRTRLVSFLIFPNADGNETLLGIDFLINFNISVDFGNAKWHFADSEKQFDLLSEKATKHIESVPVSSVLRDEEGSCLSDEQREVLAQFLSENEDVFELQGKPTTFAEHVIDTGDHAPVSVPPYRLTPAKKVTMQSEIEKMLADDIIEECESAWGSPALLVPKKNGKVRFCVDYRKLNAITKTDVYPMPLIDELVQSTKRNCIMSTLDMRSGFWNVSVRECDRDKTAFLTPFGTYRFKRMPFGLKNAPSTFQRLIDKLRSSASLKNVTLLAYQDDLLVISEGFEQHIEDLRAVFERLRQFNLRANREKCVFARLEVKYLGHVINQEGISPDHDKVRAVADMKPPTSLRHLKTFLQTCSWFRKFILNFSEVAEPLTRLLRKNQPWIWGSEQIQAFQELKKRLTSAPILIQADYNKPFVLRTDASNYALGAVLLQGEGKDEHPIEYASRLLSPAERNYSTTEREALAVVWAVERFRGYIEGHHVVIGSDHQPLKWLLSLKSPSGRLVRWALKLQEFNIQFEYTPGRANVVADTLSRPTCEESNKDECGVCSVVVDLPTRSPADLRLAQLEDPDLKKIVTSLESNDAVEDKRWSERGYFLQQGVLYRYNPDVDVEEPQLVLPASLRLDVLRECHDTPVAGHQGIDRTLCKLSQRFFFPGMRRYVVDFIKSCATCQRYKSSNLKPSGLLQTPILNQRGEVLAIDLFGPLPPGEKGEKYILLVEDTATRWVELFALVDATSEACARTLIEEYFLRYGLPRRIVSDNGVQFISAVMQQCMFILDIKQDLLPLYHPEANPAERKNRDLKVQLAQLVDIEHSSWPDHLPSVRFAMNSAMCQTTGVTPAYLTFARDLRSPVDVHFDIRAVLNKDNFVPQITPYLKRFLDSLVSIRDRVEKEQDRRKDYADKGRKSEEFDVGDQVLVKSHVLSNAAKGLSAKFVPKRDGPYMIVKKSSPTTYLVSKLNAPNDVLGRFHASQLTPFVNRDDAPPSPVLPKRNRGRPRQIFMPDSTLERVHERGRFHEPEGECIADVSTRKLPLREGRGKAATRYSP